MIEAEIHAEIVTEMKMAGKGESTRVESGSETTVWIGRGIEVGKGDAMTRGMAQGIAEQGTFASGGRAVVQSMIAVARNDDEMAAATGAGAAKESTGGGGAEAAPVAAAATELGRGITADGGAGAETGLTGSQHIHLSLRKAPMEWRY
jgi:hypothetical protein